MDFVKRLKVRPGKAVRLEDFDPDDTAGIDGKQAAQDLVTRNLERLVRLQYRLYAENRRALLIVLQGMDAAGKDGTIRHVAAGLNPQGCRVSSFKEPSREELAHDFLWRIHRAVPARGSIGIFNRSHYEDILVVRVHKLVPKSEWSTRYEQINRFEQILAGTGTTIIKFFLHISRDEQRRRLRERLDDPAKNWKFTMDDVQERRYWDEYADAYQDVLSRCSTAWAPWFVIPANHKWFRNLAVSTIVAATLKAMDPRIPEPLESLDKIRIR